MAGGRRRRSAAPTAPRWIPWSLALIALGFTFTLGVLAGRHSGHHPAAVATAAPTQKVATPRRSGLTETRVEHAPPIQEKLTFYQTLTAPLGAVAPSEKANAPAKPAPTRARPTQDRAPEATPTSKASGDAPARTRTAISQVAATEPMRVPPSGVGSPPPDADPDPPTPASKAARPAADGDRRDPGPEWTVQVGVFGSAEQAAGVKRQLAAKGFDAQVTPVSSSEGQVRYRVRVGAFKTKDEAIRTADRVRADRSIPTYVTAAK